MSGKEDYDDNDAELLALAGDDDGDDQVEDDDAALLALAGTDDDEDEQEIRKPAVKSRASPPPATQKARSARAKAGTQRRSSKMARNSSGRRKARDEDEEDGEV